MPNFVVMDFTPGPYAAELGNVEGIEDDWELLRGIPRAEGWPEKASFRMDDNFPDDLQLEDLMRNSPRLVLASRRLKELVEAESLPELEFLPTAIINHKGRKVKDPFWIIHPIHLPRCIDEAQSVMRRNAINPALISRVQKLVIDEARIPAGTRLFRPQGYPFVVLVERKLAGRLSDAGLTGLAFSEIEEHQG